MRREELACDISAGLAGWYQLQHVQRLGNLSGEDSARFLIAQVVNSQGRFAPATSQLPQNWGSTKKRVDVAIKGRADAGAGWYGAIEIKWPGESFDSHAMRLNIVQDAMRLSFIKTGNLNARFLVLGGSQSALEVLFDNPHVRAQDREDRRVSFGRLLSRDMSNPKRVLLYREWSRNFAEAGARIPDTVFGGFDGRLKCELLSESSSVVAENIVGQVFVWQCSRTRGTA